MKRIVSLILSLLMILSALSMFAGISFAEGQAQTMLITPSRFGAWENWVNSPNLMGDYESTTQLLVEATDADGNALTLPADAQWELTISDGTTSKTIKMNPATTYPDANLYRFETCNGTGENKFVPVKGTTYTVSAKIYSGGTVAFESTAVSGFTCNMDPVDPAVEIPEPEGTATLTLGAWYDKIENWGTPKRTYFIVGISASECNEILYTRLKNGRYKMYVTVTDETAATTKTVYYPINLPADELYGTTMVRLALGEKGVKVVKDHAYTLEIKVYNAAGELKYSGKSETGAFASTQEDFLTNGPIDTSHYPTNDESSPLNEKSVLFVGDSITEAICEVNIAQTKMMAGWPGRIGVANNMYYVNKGVSGASVSDCRGSNTVLNQLSAMKNRSFDLLIMHGGVNDAWDSTAVGSMTAIDNFDETTFDQTTFAGGLEYIFWYAKTYYPDAVKGYIINFRLPGSSIGRLADMSEYFSEAKKICDKWEIPYLDMYNNEELNARMKATTRYALGDYIHPNDRGYDILYPFVEQFCECIMQGGDPSTLTDPAPLPEEGSSIGADEINIALGKPAKNGAGTSSYVPTNGSIDQYFMAGNWDAEDGSCYIEIDLGAAYDLNKINVVTYVGNLLYQWKAYISTDNTLAIDDWTYVGGMLSTNMSYEDGNTIAFDTTSARYVRIYGVYDNASTAFVINEVSVYGDVDTSATTTEVAGGTSATLPGGTTDNKLTDGNKVSDPAVITPVLGGNVTVDLGQSAEISEIKIYTYSNVGAYEVYASVNGTNWTYLGTKGVNASDAVYSASTGCVYTLTVDASYRYVMVQGIESGRTDYCCALGEVEIFDAKDAQLTIASATAEKTVYAASKATDGDYLSYCFLKRPEGNMAIDLGEAYDMREVVVYPAENTEDLQIQVSADNSNWFTVGTVKANSTDTVTCHFAGSYRYLRIAHVGANAYSIYEIEVLAVADTTEPEPEPEPEPDVPEIPEGAEEIELSDKGDVTASFGADALYTGNANNGTTSSYTLLKEGENCYMILDLQQGYLLSRVIVNALNKNYTFKLYGSIDGTTWTEIGANEVSDDYVMATGYEIAVSGNYRYVKLEGIETQSGYFAFYEIDVYGYEPVSTDAVVKFEGHQMGEDKSSVRFIGSVSGLEYKNVDLQITVTGNAERTFTRPTTKVFQALKGVIEGAQQVVAATKNYGGTTGEYTTVFENADYLYGYAITGIDAGTYTFTIVPVATKTDGTVIKGKTATLTLTFGA